MSSRRESHGKSCTNCNNRPADKARGDNLCAKCAHKLPRVSCPYCAVSFRLLARHSHLPPSQQSCPSCTSDLQLYGAPSICSLCRFQAAFDNAPMCRHCTSDSKRFGAPRACVHCGYGCAFERDAESRAKVDDLLLCYLCTHSYKQLKKKERADLSADQLRERFSKKEPEKRPREEDVAANLAAAAASNGGGGKRQKLEASPSFASSSSAAAAAAASSLNASPAASPSPSPSPSSFSLAGSSSSAAAGASSSAANMPPSAATLELQSRVARLEKENQLLRQAGEERTQKLLLLNARAAEATRNAEEARAALTKKEKECNQLRGELEAAKRALQNRKDAIRAELHTEALRASEVRPLASSQTKSQSSVSQEDEDSDIKFARRRTGKLSLPGALKVRREGGVGKNGVAIPAEENELKVVFDNGPVPGHVWDDFSTVRERVKAQWSSTPKQHNPIGPLMQARIAEWIVNFDASYEKMMAQINVDAEAAAAAAGAAASSSSSSAPAVSSSTQAERHQAEEMQKEHKEQQ